MTLTLAEAQAMAAAVRAAAETRALQPLAIVVLDAGGHDLVVLRSERAGFYRVEIARAKATSCLGMGLDGADLAERAKAAPAFYAALAPTMSGGIGAPSTTPASPSKLTNWEAKSGSVAQTARRAPIVSRMCC